MNNVRRRCCPPTSARPALALAFATLIVALAPVAQAGSATPSQAQVQRALDEEVLRQGLPGAVAAARLPGGEIIAVASGYADRDSRTLMTPTHRFLGASIGKTFVAAFALDTARRGLLDLDRPISHWFAREAWFEHLPNGKDITVRMLLTHTSGLPDHVHAQRFVELRSRGIDPDRVFAPHELIGFILDEPSVFQAGHGFAYSDTNYILAGLILEAVTERPVFDSIMDRFVNPLHLTLTRPSDSRSLAGLATGYTARDDGSAEQPLLQKGLLLYNPASEWTGGGLVTNPRDLVVWSRALYRGEAMRDPYLNELLAPGTPEPVPMPWARVFSHYGLAVMLRDTPFGRAYGHTGGIPGFASIMSYFPERDIALAIMTNRSEQVDRLALERAVMSALLP